MNVFLISVLVFGGVLVFWSVRVYNALVELKNQVSRSWANIDVILKQRFDEIPQIVQILEQYVQYERGTIDRLVEARKHYASAHGVDQKIHASQEMSQALRGVFAIGEAYPELRSNENFMQLQTRISELENALADRREHFNETVTNFNTRIAKIPDVFFAGALGYGALSLFEVAAAEKVTPSLKLNLPK